jgi:hypothetical protein
MEAGTIYATLKDTNIRFSRSNSPLNFFGQLFLAMHWPLSPRTKASEQSQPDMQISLQICGFP